MIAAGLDGVEQGLTLADPVEESLFEMDAARIAEKGIRELPGHARRGHRRAGARSRHRRGARRPRPVPLRLREAGRVGRVPHPGHRLGAGPLPRSLLVTAHHARPSPQQGETCPHEPRPSRRSPTTRSPRPRTTSSTPAPTSTASTCSTRRPSASTSPSRSSSKLRRTIDGHEPFDPAIVDAVAHGVKEWAMAHGATHYTHWFVPMTGSTAEKHDSFLSPDGRRPDDRRVLGQEPAPGRAGRVVVPVGRHPRHLRGPRLHRVGRDLADLPPGRAERRHADDPDRVRLVHRRGARPQDPAAALAGGAGQAGAARPALVRQHDRQPRVHEHRARAGVLPRRPPARGAAARPRSSPAARCSAPRRPRARSWRTSTSARSASGSSRS